MATLQERRAKARPVDFKSLAVDAGGIMAKADSRTISGYAAIFNNIDEAGDMIIKGAFSKSITERGPGSNTNRKIILLWQHDMENPLGRITKLEENDKGLYFEAELDQIPDADRALTQINSGTLNQFSIGYKYVWDRMEWDSENDCCVCKELNLFEISVVSIGCNELTGFSGMKAAELESEQNQLQRDIEKAIKGIPDSTQQYLFRKLFARQVALNEAAPPQAPLPSEPPTPGLFTTIGKKL